MNDILKQAKIIKKKILFTTFVESYTRSVSMDRESKCLAIETIVKEVILSFSEHFLIAIHEKYLVMLYSLLYNNKFKIF